MASIMATGYVHEMLDKQLDFPAFALTCAKAFGALIEMRDEPLGAPIPKEFKPSAHYLESREKVIKEVAELEAMTAEERMKYGVERKENEIQRLREGLTKEQGEVLQCRAMLKQVEAWQPPTSDHVNMKEFMIEQLNTSMRGNLDYYHESLQRAEECDPMEYYTRDLDSKRSMIDTYQKYYDEEVQRVNQRNLWVRQLRDSLAPQSNAVPA